MRHRAIVACTRQGPSGASDGQLPCPRLVSTIHATQMPHIESLPPRYDSSLVGAELAAAMAVNQTRAMVPGMRRSADSASSPKAGECRDCGTPLSHMSALREAMVIQAMHIGVQWFKACGEDSR